MNKKKDFVLVIIVAILSILLIIFSLHVKAGKPKTETVTVTVQEGDTLWGLWERYGYGRADKWIDKVEKVNGIKGARIVAGDKLNVEALK